MMARATISDGQGTVAERCYVTATSAIILKGAPSDLDECILHEYRAG